MMDVGVKKKALVLLEGVRGLTITASTRLSHQKKEM